MITRREACMVLPLLGGAFSSHVQAKLPRVGVLTLSVQNRLLDTERGRGFLAGLGESGWVDGRNVAINMRFSDGRAETPQANAAELVRLKVDVLAALAVPEILAARAATTTIPITGIDLVSDPVVRGWVTSLARPGGNFTGVFLDVPELVVKHVALLREALPNLKRIGAVGDPAINAAQFRHMAAQALPWRMEVVPLEVRSVADLDTAFARAARGAAQALVLFPSPLMFSSRASVGDMALRHRVAAISTFPEIAQAGALMAFGPSLAEMWQRCGAQAGRLLKGEAVATMPIERPYRFTFSVNLRAAKAIGLQLPQSLLLRAEEVIQ